MEKTYKFIRISESTQSKSTRVFFVINKSSGSHLGTIEMYAPWRKYCLMAYDGVVFSDDCLKDIIDFISLIK